MRASVLIAAFVMFVAYSIFEAAMFLTSNAILSPLIEMIDRTQIHPLLHVERISYVVPFIWAILLISEIAVVGSLLIMAFREQDNEEYYGGAY